MDNAKIEALEQENERLKRDLTFYRSTLGLRGDWAESEFPGATGHHLWDYCQNCQFGTVEKHNDPYSFPPMEPKVHCSLINKQVYSGRPECTVGDWVKRLGIVEPLVGKDTLRGIWGKETLADVEPVTADSKP